MFRLRRRPTKPYRASEASRGGKDSVLARIDKVVLVSGFCATPEGYSIDQLSGLSVPSLHIVGSKDSSVPAWRSEELHGRFTPASAHLLRHDKGHVVPSQAGVCDAIVHFLASVLDK